MGRIRQIGTGIAAVLMLIPMVGCFKSLPTMDEVTSLKFVHLEPVAATQLICFWQPQIQTLPDPTADGRVTIGLSGQSFLIGPEGEHADVTGSLAVAVYDDTPRPEGQPSRTTEIWHYTKETLQQLTAKDTRFGRCYAVFLPWSPEWTDVTHVRISARYDTPGHPTIYSPEIKMKIEFQATAASGDWNVLERQRDLRHLSGQSIGVPDPSQFVQQMASGTTSGQQGIAQPAIPNAGQPSPEFANRGWDTSVHPMNQSRIETVAATRPAPVEAMSPPPAMPSDHLGTAAWKGPPPTLSPVPRGQQVGTSPNTIQPIIIGRPNR